jgi:hypothetical protein
MADHPLVTAAREAHNRGDHVFQHPLVLQGGRISHRRATMSMEAEEPNPVLNAIAEVGWELVTGQLTRHPANQEILSMIYLWKRRA